MSAEGEGSVTHWIADLKEGDEDAARQLWQRYFDQLARLARVKLRSAPRAMADEEDVALSAFHSLCAAAARGRFSQLNDRDDLWRLLVTITARKAVRQAVYHRRQKRGGGQVQGEVGGLDGDSGHGAELDQVAGREPSPEFAAMLAEQYGLLLEGLRDETLRQIARLRLEGYTSDEIAGQLGCNRRTVTRKLELIRTTWQEDELA
jgi:DNA-directed RNA polymerase specialized sigma24 family protein